MKDGGQYASPLTAGEAQFYSDGGFRYAYGVAEDLPAGPHLRWAGTLKVFIPGSTRRWTRGQMTAREPGCLSLPGALGTEGDSEQRRVSHPRSGLRRHREKPECVIGLVHPL